MEIGYRFVVSKEMIAEILQQHGLTVRHWDIEGPQNEVLFMGAICDCEYSYEAWKDKEEKTE